MGMSPNEVRVTTFGDLQAAFRGWQMSQGIDPESASRGSFDRSDLNGLMARFPDEAVH